MAKILLVEDDKSLREIYGVRLMAEGYEIVSAGDGEEALALAIKERPDLIVSDVMMPKISGFDMLDILRSTSETKDVKVIMMTALSSDDQRARGEALGADRYLVKSQVGIEDVVRTVHDVLGDGLPGVTVPTAIAAPSFAPNPVAAIPAAPVAQVAPVAPFAPAAPLAAPVDFTATPMPAAAVSLPEPIGIPSPVSTPLAPTPIIPQPTEFMAQPVIPTAPVAPQVMQNPISAPAVVPQPVPANVAPAPLPFPAQAPNMPVVPSALPQPTAPFSSPAPASLGQRIIEPLTTPAPIGGTQPFDISAQMEQALNTSTAAQPAPGNPPLPPVQ